MADRFEFAVYCACNARSRYIGFTDTPDRAARSAASFEALHKKPDCRVVSEYEHRKLFPDKAYPLDDLDPDIVQHLTTVNS